MVMVTVILGGCCCSGGGGGGGVVVYCTVSRITILLSYGYFAHLM